MEDDLPYVLSEEDFERMAAAVRRVEGLPPRRESQTRSVAGDVDAPHNWVKITSASSQTINLYGGGTATGYPAVWSYYDSGASGWIDTANTVWFVGANAEAPVNATRYLCRCIGADVNGQTIWSTDIPAGGGGGSGFALHDKNDATIDAACTVLRLDAAGIITATNTSAGHDTLSVTDAGSTQRGVVNTSAQTFAGDKSFQDNANVGNKTGVLDGTKTLTVVDTIKQSDASLTQSFSLQVAASAPPQPDSYAWGVSAIVGQGAGTPSFSVGDTSFAFATVNNLAIKMYVSDGTALVQCATGSGGAGDVFVGGLCKTLGSNSNVLAATITASQALTGTMTDISGVSITLPSAGKYLLLAQVTANISDTATGAQVSAQLNNNTDGAVVPNTNCQVITCDMVSGPTQIQTAPILMTYTVTASKVIRLQANVMGGSMAATANCLADCNLMALRIGS